MVMNAQTAPTQNGTSQWWPSKYGADDEAGALNEITPAKVLEAVRLVRQGRVYDLAHVLHQDIPAFPGRTFRQYLTTNYRQINRRVPTRARRAWGATASTGSSSRSPRPSRWAPTWTGSTTCRWATVPTTGSSLPTSSRITAPAGWASIPCPQVVTRGLLLDVAAARGGERLQPGDVITVADAERALAVTGLDVRPGDAVFFHTGWAVCGVPTTRSRLG